MPEKGIQGSEREVLGCTSGIKPVKTEGNLRKPPFWEGAGHKLGKAAEDRRGKKDKNLLQQHPSVS